MGFVFMKSIAFRHLAKQYNNLCGWDELDLHIESLLRLELT